MSIVGLLGRKIGMAQVFDRKGIVHPVTVVEAGPCTVVQVKNPGKDGYSAVQLGFGATKRVNQPMKGHLKGTGEFRYLREFSVDDAAQWEAGQKVSVELFNAGDFVDVTGISKGKGFAGGVKRHGFRGGPRTHGQSDRLRAPGSIGPGSSPGRVVKGLRMAGHMGADRVTVRNLLVLDSDPARGVLLIEGAVPGARNGLLRICRSPKTPASIAGIERAVAEEEEPVVEETAVEVEAEAGEETSVNEEAPAEAETPEEQSDDKE